MNYGQWNITSPIWYHEENNAGYGCRIGRQSSKCLPWRLGWYLVSHRPPTHSLTPCEQKYSQIERGSLSQAWGMNVHRYYLLDRTSSRRYTDSWGNTGLHPTAQQGETLQQRTLVQQIIQNQTLSQTWEPAHDPELRWPRTSRRQTRMPKPMWQLTTYKWETMHYSFRRNQNQKPIRTRNISNN